MHNDLQDSIKARLYDMKYTPFLASYVIGWIFFNAKTFLIFFSDIKVSEKIEMLAYADLLYLYPLFVALFYTLIFPIFGAAFYYVTLQYKRLMNYIKQQIQDVTPLPQEEANALLRENSELRLEHDEKIKALNITKESFETQKQVLNEQYNDLESLYKKSQDDLKSANEQIKQKIATLAKLEEENKANKKLIKSQEEKINNLKAVSEHFDINDYLNFINGEAIQTAIENAQSEAKLDINNYQKNAENALKTLKDTGALANAIKNAQGDVGLAIDELNNNGELIKAIENAQNSINKLRNIPNPRSSQPKIKDNLTMDEQDILKIIYDNNISLASSQNYIHRIYSADSKFKTTKIRHLLDSLVKKELISLTNGNYDTTSKGREIMIKLFD